MVSICLWSNLKDSVRLPVSELSISPLNDQEHLELWIKSK